MHHEQLQELVDRLTQEDRIKRSIPPDTRSFFINPEDPRLSQLADDCPEAKELLIRVAELYTLIDTPSVVEPVFALWLLLKFTCVIQGRQLMHLAAYCRYDARLLLAALRTVQLGFIDRSELHIAINMRYPEPESMLKAVQKRLPTFGIARINTGLPRSSDGP